MSGFNVYPYKNHRGSSPILVPYLTFGSERIGFLPDLIRTSNSLDASRPLKSREDHNNRQEAPQYPTLPGPGTTKLRAHLRAHTDAAGVRFRYLYLRFSYPLQSIGGRMKTRAVGTAILVLMLSFAVYAQMEPPTVPDAVNGLKKFVGRWNSDATLVIEGKSYKVDYHVEGREIAEGNGVYLDEWFTSPELGALKGGNLVGYDPYDSKIHWYSVDNMGTTHEHVGAWQTPDHLFVEHQGMRDGKRFVEKIEFRFNGTNELRFKLVATLDGKEVEAGEGIFKRTMMTGKK